MALCFNSPTQAMASTLNLISLYTYLTSLHCPSDNTRGVKTQSLVFCTIALAFNLLDTYPSQTSYFRFLQTISCLNLDPDSEQLQWVTSIQRSMNRNNYFEFAQQTDPGRLMAVVSCLPPNNQMLCKDALICTVSALRNKVRKCIWNIVRVSYRELSFEPTVDTSDWLSRTLMLDTDTGNIDVWIGRSTSEGHLVLKEGSKLRYLVRKPA